MIGSKSGSFIGFKGGNTTDDGETIHRGQIAASRAGGGYYRDMDGYLQWADAAPGYKKPTTTTTPTPTTTPTTTPTSYSPNNYTEPAPTTPTPQVAPTQQPTYYTPPSGPKGVGQTGVTGGTTPQTQTVRPDRPSQNQGWTTANTHTGTEVYYDPNENRWEFGRGTPVGKAGLAHILAQQPAQQNTYTPPATQQQQPAAQAVVPQAEATPPAMPTWDQVYGDALDIEGRKARTEDPRQDPRVLAGTHYLGWGDAVLPYARTVQSADWGGIVSGNDAYDSLTPKEKIEANKRYYKTHGVRGVNTSFTKHNADAAQKSVDALNAWKQYEDVIDQPWGTPRRDAVIDLWRDGKLTYDEYRAGAHNVSPNQDGVYDAIDNQSFDGRYGSSGWSASGLPVPESPYARPQQQDTRPPLGSGQQMQAAQYRAAQQQPQQTQMPQQSMAQQYGWGAGLGGQPQQQMPQWGQPQQQPWGGQQQQQAMPQWGPPPQQMMPQWGQPQGMGGMMGGMMGGQQQMMPQWGQMMQPMGGPMAGMEAARMGGGAMQQMGGGSPWASMWGDPFAGRQMTTDPNSPAMGGLPQMDPSTQLMMQMQGMGGGGLSGGFGAGGGSSGGGGMSGGGQTGAAQTGGGMDYDGLASILALFAGGGYGGGGGGGAYGGYNPMYGGLPRNGLFYADLMGAGG